MKKLFLACIFLIAATSGFASNLCGTPRNSSVIYFGNGINTTRESAIGSIRLLIDNLGREYNGQQLEFAIAYNQTGGIAVDLLQSEMQLNAQFDSQIMLWLNGIGLLPDKVTTWYKDYVMQTVVIVAEEVAEHASFYLTDILDGKRVVIVSHSQGNFYVNEAKDLLAKQLKSEKMASFKIFGVATPANNVGGDKSPYLTNHRDFIQYVPRALPANWKLFRSNKSDADDVGVIQAHLFNTTYISDDFDIKTNLIPGIKNQIDAAMAPISNCNSYTADILSMVAGHYSATCGFGPDAVVKNFDISAFGMTDYKGNWIDLGDNSPPPLIGLRVNSNNFKNHVSLSAISFATRQLGGASWDASGVYEGPGSLPCYVDRTTPRTMLDKNVDIAGKFSSVLSGFYRLLPANSCFYSDTDISGNEKPIEFSLNGAMAKLGERQWSLVGDIQTISTFKDGSIDGAHPESANDSYLFFTSHIENVDISLWYGRRAELLQFSVKEFGSKKAECFFNRSSAKL